MKPSILIGLNQPLQKFQRSPVPAVQLVLSHVVQQSRWLQSSYPTRLVQRTPRGLTAESLDISSVMSALIGSSTQPRDLIGQSVPKLPAGRKISCRGLLTPEVGVAEVTLFGPIRISHRVSPPGVNEWHICYTTARAFCLGEV